MFKGFPIVIIVCLFTFFANGALGRIEPKSPASAAPRLGKQELQSLLRPYLSLKSLKADFVQKKHLADLNMNLISTGKLEVEKPRKVLWTVLKPSFLEVSIAEKDLTMTSMKDGQKQVQKISFEQMGSEQGAKGLALLLPWLEMDVDKLLAEYTIVETAPSELQFTPSTKSLFKYIGLKLAKNKHIETLTFTEQNGDSISIEFKGAKIENTK